jgi:Flp pilus assembly protein TadG
MRRRFARDANGAAAVEFALWLGVLALPVLNVVDLGYYGFQAIQVREAAQAAVESAVANCATQLPATTNCAALTGDIATAAHSTSLGANVAVASYATNSVTSDTFEGYFCSNTSNALVAATVASGSNPWSTNATSTPNEPASCSASTGAKNADAVGDYVSVTVTYAFRPLFPGVTVASLLPSTIRQQAWMRLG